MADGFHPSRRRFLEYGSAALAAGALGRTTDSQTREEVSEAEHDASSSLILGQDNPALHAENLDSVTPPATDHGNLSSFKYPFSLAH